MFLLALLFVSVSAVNEAQAIPAFALREKFSCVMCHANGSPPHLTPFGYLYRRAGFRLPDNIGNKELDAKYQTFPEHMAVGLTLSYDYLSNKAPGASKYSVTANQINVPEVEFWPLVGAFFGNFGTWSEIDAVPGTTTTSGIGLSQSDIRYVSGTADSFFNFRGGLIAPEGFGASDQWLHDGNIPLMDRVTAYYNQDTLTAPFGAMGQPELGVEVGYNHFSSHVTLGMYDGFSGVSSNGAAASSLTPILTNRSTGIGKDYKLQLDQFIGDIGAVTVGYYKGYIHLSDPSFTSIQWNDSYNAERVYLTYFAIPGTLDLLAGAGLSTHQYATTTTDPTGTFKSKGGFIGAMYYAAPHLTLAGRLDYNKLNDMPDAPARVLGYSLQASLPYENNQFIFHANFTHSDETDGADVLAGNTRDLGFEWRFLF